ncbi:AEC family transporter [Faecalicatena contorta]|uniref:AEC family transporter n=1 Tax=Faecalicatena contorta TaxID=39482 RepID=UPI001F2B0714|nr:AEC family transporter [Faecalicatena contorta]MCF2683492.1 AEC family transporter [Faecalicatena contorta]
MELASITLYKTLVMVILALAGVMSYKTGIVDEEINKKLSDLVLTLFTPILLFTSFQKEFTPSLLSGLGVSVVLSVLSFAVIWCICKIVVQKQNQDYAAVEHVAIMYSNCGFIGIPMAQGIFGADGVFYMTAYVALANFLLWSHGIIVMSGKMDVKSLKKVFTSPTIIAIILGVLCFFLQIRMPTIIEEPLEMIANMNTPMAMMVAGINIAQADLKHTFKKVRLYWLSFVKLIVMPMVLIGLFYFLPVDNVIKTVMILASSCPVGVTGSLFALRYGKDAVYASELFSMSTLLSIITVPFMMLFC